MNKEYIVLKNSNKIIALNNGKKTVLNNNSKARDYIKCENKIETINQEMNLIKDKKNNSDNKLKYYKQSGFKKFITFSIVPYSICLLFLLGVALNIFTFNINIPFVLTLLTMKIYGTVSGIYAYYKYSDEKMNNLYLSNKIDFLTNELSKENKKLEDLKPDSFLNNEISIIKVDYKNELRELRQKLFIQDNIDIENGVYKKNDYITKAQKVLKKIVKK